MEKLAASILERLDVAKSVRAASLADRDWEAAPRRCEGATAGTPQPPKVPCELLHFPTPTSGPCTTERERMCLGPRQHPASLRFPQPPVQPESSEPPNSDEFALAELRARLDEGLAGIEDQQLELQ